MADREKVIRALENCTDEIKCRDCPWETCENFCLSVKVPLDLAKAALSLLKAQEPRVMTLEEIKKAEVVWLECYGICSNMFKAALPWHSLSINNATWDFKTYPYTEVMFLAEYGRNWRCWTSRPTDEQREAVKWND